MKTKQIAEKNYKTFEDYRLNYFEMNVIRGGDGELPGEQDPGEDPPTFPEEG